MGFSAFPRLRGKIGPCPELRQESRVSDRVESLDSKSGLLEPAVGRSKGPCLKSNLEARKLSF